MKNFLSIITLFFAAITIISCDSKNMAQANTDTETNTTNQLDLNSSEVGEAMEETTIAFNKTTHDFGTINEGEVVKTTLTVENTGEKPLFIHKAEGTCGCTTPNIENVKNKPIAPGESADIDVQFNSNGRANKQTKQVKVYGNFTPNPSVFTIIANVTPKAGSEAAADDHAGHNH